MSTFNGIIDQFPEIRIDHFRKHPQRNPPLACFLSHVHSDHLQGLESLKGVFVYCSAETKKILLRIEKYPHRINFQKGILESRKQTYKHLSKVLRPLPLQTPIEIELGPKLTIRVTLFDANHCPGAVMFLLESNGRAILYTGDIRAERWWVNALIRNPIMIPYSCGQRRLDCIYLDTTFASHDNVYSEFQSKAEGLKELIDKVNKCSQDSVFYFRAWTLGYEDVWIALANFLRTRVHVDDYQMRIFSSLAEDTSAMGQGSALIGVQVGNQIHQGCLTSDYNVKLHSCEPGMECHSSLSKREDVVWITPIISRLKDGTELAEIGAGGGGGDLYQTPEVELGEPVAIEALQTLCTTIIKDAAVLQNTMLALQNMQQQGHSILSLEGLGLEIDEEILIKEFVDIIAENKVLTEQDSLLLKHKTIKGQHKVIRFPYSRHSSYSELRYLIGALHPKDICPCTVEMDIWSEDLSMESLFGDLCSEAFFKHDQDIRNALKQRGVAPSSVSKKRRRASSESQNTSTQLSGESEDFHSAKAKLNQSGYPLTPILSSKGLTRRHHHAVIRSNSQDTLHQGIVTSSNRSQDGITYGPLRAATWPRGSNSDDHSSPIDYRAQAQRLQEMLSAGRSSENEHHGQERGIGNSVEIYPKPPSHLQSNSTRISQKTASIDSIEDQDLSVRQLRKPTSQPSTTTDIQGRGEEEQEDELEAAAAENVLERQRPIQINNTSNDIISISSSSSFHSFNTNLPTTSFHSSTSARLKQPQQPPMTSHDRDVSTEEINCNDDNDDDTTNEKTNDVNESEDAIEDVTQTFIDIESTSKTWEGEEKEEVKADTDTLRLWRKRRRFEAYQIARCCLETGDSSSWTDLGLRSIGWKGHADEGEELEL